MKGGKKAEKSAAKDYKSGEEGRGIESSKKLELLHCMGCPRPTARQGTSHRATGRAYEG